MNKKGDWAIIRDKNKSYTNLICFKDDNDAFYWGQGFGWAILTDNMEIIEYIGQVKQKDHDKLEMDYYKKYHTPIKSELKQSAGWISPNGDFYACEARLHDYLGKCLAIFIYDELDDCIRKLEKDGWIKIHYNGLLLSGDYSENLKNAMTDNQKEIIAKLSQLGNSSFNNRMKQYLGLDFDIDLELDTIENSMDN